MRPVAPEPLLMLSGVRKSYGARLVLDGIDLAVGSGEIVALLGPNGAGKTTLAEIGLGLRDADAGAVRLVGGDPRRLDRERRALVGATLERGSVPRPMRVREAVTLHAAFWRDPLAPDDVLTRLGLARVADSAYRELSAGERARLALALALVGRPQLLVLDEPTAAMDVAARRETWALLGELRDSGTGVLMTTHLVEEVRALADRVVLLAGGRLLAVEATAARRVTARLELDAAVEDGELARLTALGVQPRPLAGTAYAIEGDDPNGVLAALAAWLPGTKRRVRDLRVRGDDLEGMLEAATTDGSTDGIGS